MATGFAMVSMMTRHAVKLWHLVQVLLLSFFMSMKQADMWWCSCINSTYMKQRHDFQRLSQANATVSIYHVLTHFSTRRIQRNSSCVSRFCGSAARTCERVWGNFWARQCGLLSDTSCSHGGTGCFCAAAGICRERNTDIEGSAMQDFERLWSVDCEVWSVECEVWIGESAVWTEKCEVLTAKGAVWSVKTVKCEVWRGASSVTCETRHQFRRVHARTGLAGARRMQVL